MQPIQDKDFDKLFNNALADAEVTPSQDLWSSIESKMEPGKARKLPFYWIAAAVVLIVATVGVLVNRSQHEIISNNHAVISKIETNKPTINDNAGRAMVETPLESTGRVIKISTVLIKPVSAMSKTEVKDVEKQKISPTPDTFKEEAVVAKLVFPKEEISKSESIEIGEPKEEIAIAMIETPNGADIITENEQSGKGIRNVGDLINLVVNTVDKRKDKFIQFRTDEDDNSSLASVNIGPFKIGNRKHK